jgi:hypothetical protein
MWAENVVRNWFIARATAPNALDMVRQYPNHNKILYEGDKETGALDIKWNVPGIQDCISIMNNPHIYDPKLCGWIQDCFNGKLDNQGILLSPE